MNRADKFWMWLAWRLPRGLVYWASVRSGVHATSGEHAGQEVPGVTIIEILERWRR